MFEETITTEKTTECAETEPRFRITLNGYHGDTSTDITIEGDDLAAMTDTAVRLCTEIHFPFQRRV